MLFVGCLMGLLPEVQQVFSGKRHVGPCDTQEKFRITTYVRSLLSRASNTSRPDYTAARNLTTDAFVRSANTPNNKKKAEDRISHATKADASPYSLSSHHQKPQLYTYSMLITPAPSHRKHDPEKQKQRAQHRLNSPKRILLP